MGKCCGDIVTLSNRQGILKCETITFMYKYKGFIFKMVMSLYEIAYFQGKKAYLEEIMIKCRKCGSNQFNLKTYPQGNELTMDINTFNNTLNIQYDVDIDDDNDMFRVYCKECGELIFGETENQLIELIKGRHTLFITKMNIKSGI